MAKTVSKSANKAKTSKVAVKSKAATKPVAKKAVIKHAVKAVGKKPAAKPTVRALAVKKKSPAKPGMVKQLMQAMLGAGKKVAAASKAGGKAAAAKATKIKLAKAKSATKAKPASKAKSQVKAKPQVKEKSRGKAKPVQAKPMGKTKPQGKVKAALGKSAKNKSVVSSATKPVVKAIHKTTIRPVLAAKTGVSVIAPSNKPVASAKPGKTATTMVPRNVVRAVAVVPSAKNIAKRGASATPARKPEPGAERVVLPKGYAPSAKESYMSARQQEFFRQKLETWRSDLVEESKQTIDNLRDEVRDVGDEAERATRETENSLELRTRDRYRKLIAKIDEALRRIDEGQYGYCVDTGDEIGLERLTARPTAERTVDAQERWEHRQKQMGE